MNKFITSFCAFCSLLILSAEQAQAQLSREPQPAARIQQESLIKVDENFDKSFEGLVNKDVEVIGRIGIPPAENKGEFAREVVLVGSRLLILTNWERLWAKKKVRIIGHVTKGIDDSVGLEKYGGMVPAMNVRVEYLLTIKSIELLEDQAPKPEQVPQTAKPRLAPQAPTLALPKPPQAPAPAKPLVRIDQNFKSYYGDLIGQEVEVFGRIRSLPSSSENMAFIDPGDLGGFEIAMLDSQWFSKNVRIVGTITKGIDPREEAAKKAEKSGGPLLTIVYRDFYVLSVKTIELAGPQAVVNQAPQLVPPMVPQR